mgnify:CR=1 FL=1
MDASFVWDDNFVTHVPAVDEQHHGLVDLFNELSNALFAQTHDREAVLADIYGRLLAYTEYHFTDEEELMAQYGLDPRHVDNHRAMHQQFIQQVTLLWSQHATMTDPGTTLVGFLTSWLSLHILGIDQSMARQISSVRQGLTPEAAFARERDIHDNGTEALLKMIGRLYTVLSTQNAQLALANQSLEERVAQRTHELETANARLRTLSRTDALLGIAGMKHRLDAGKGSAGNADPLARLEQRLRGLGLFALAQQADQRVVDPGRPGAETDEPLHTQGGAHGRPACAAAIAAKPHKQVAGEHGLNNHCCPLAADFFHAQPGQVAAVALAFQIDEGRLFLPRFGVDHVPGGLFVRRITRPRRRP